MTSANWSLAQQLVRHENWVYCPGEIWFRIDPATWTVEGLGGGTPPNPWTLQGRFHYGVSAHYGLVAWTGNRVFQVVVNPPLDGDGD